MKYLISIIILATTSISCKKLYPDDELSMSRQNYNGNTLRLDGYYSYDWGDAMNVYFFYFNGVILDGNSFEKQELEEKELKYVNGEFYDFAKNSKLNWGVFKIESDIIKFEQWYPGSGPAKRAYIREGKVLNDTTFHITKSYRMKNGKKKDENNQNEIYHFKKFSPKPDSTNKFIE